ncbi:ATP-dependent RecD-like DNA helicase [wastewater metagenome]|uniref:ATP-dependent RecD-like DNA helicase n=2 Tax=unclassified sequences TaxID=12908 RepID=A0A5B8RGI7_9ZZZZ|nr:MobF family relaxase [Arhodomonas sp. KWT]QEA06988.1 ATP-dependent RecD-like DNA helicase [uncultured organism]
MLSISARGAADEAMAYYVHLAADDGPEDYYASEGAGVWHGAGAAALGLTGDVAAEDFRAAAEGRSGDGEALVQGAGAAHRAGWDLTFSAPKSVSAVWAVAEDDERAAIAAAHDRAVSRALAHIEAEFSVARRGRGGHERERAGLVIATYQHGTSRALDPQLHTHSFVMNLARRADGSWGGIDPREIYRHKLALGAIYRAELAAALRAEGYAVAADGDSFRLAGVPDGVTDQFSMRRQQIDAALAERGVTGARASEVAALDTREAKAEIPERAVLHERWRAKAAVAGFAAEDTRAAAASAPAPEPMPTPAELLRQATAHEAVIEERHVWRAVAVAAQHRGEGLETIREHVDRVLADEACMRLVGDDGTARYTTRELYRAERAIIDSARSRASETHHAVGAGTVTAAIEQHARAHGFRLSDEQAAAVRHVTAAAGAVRAIVGDAGTGKSAALGAARLAWQAAGQRVIGAAPSGKAAAGLEAGSGIASRTLASLLHALDEHTDDGGDVQPSREQLTARDVIVLDEAGMVDSRTMARLMAHADAAGARVVMSGDPKQLQAVGAGGVFRHLAGDDAAQITQIRRQRDEWARTATQAFAAGEAAAAVEQYVDRGLVHVADDQRQAVARAVDRWAEHVSERGAAETLLMANTNAEVAALNAAARERAAADGRLVGHETEIQTRDRNGRATGRIAVAAGDRLLAKVNDRETGLKNGDLMSVERLRHTAGGAQIVARVDRTGEAITIDPARYAQLRHGYAVTTHAAQGATVDRAVVLAGGAMTSRESTYVQMSRHRDSAEIIATRQQLRTAADHLAPSEQTIERVQATAEAAGVDAPAEALDSLAAAQAWLAAHGAATTDVQELRDLVAAMGESRQAVTTLDYAAADTTHETDAAREAAATRHEAASAAVMTQ